MPFSDRLTKALNTIDIQRHGAGAWLSKQTGVTVKAANKWLNGESCPHRKNIERIAELTRVRTEWLEYGEGTMRSPHKSAKHLNEPSAKYSATSIAQPITENCTQVNIPFYKESELIQTRRPTTLAARTFDKVLLDQAGTNTENSFCFHVSGDSMSPVLPNNSLVAINASDIEISDGKIYAFEHGGLLRVKYLYRLPYGSLSIRSANPSLADETLQPDQTKHIRILGRVFWYSVTL